MLKIIDDVDLKELEKYGLKESKHYNCSTGELEFTDYIFETPFVFDIVFVHGYDRVISSNIYNFLAKSNFVPSSDIITPMLSKQIEHILYSLIKADLVEEVGDK